MNSFFKERLAELDRLAAADAAQAIARIEAAGPQARGLFIDCGSNLGQGFQQFARHYPTRLFDYVLIEPNPNCQGELRRLASRDAMASIQIIEQAAGTQLGTVRFFGLAQDPTSQGASMLKEHNSAHYSNDDATAIEVPVFPLADLIEQRAPRYASVILKLDIEGGEYEVLPHLIGRAVHKLIDAAYIEFHTQYMAEPDRSRFLAIEQAVRGRLAADGVNYHVWI